MPKGRPRASQGRKGMGTCNLPIHDCLATFSARLQPLNGVHSLLLQEPKVHSSMAGGSKHQRMGLARATFPLPYSANTWHHWRLIMIASLCVCMIFFNVRLVVVVVCSQNKERERPCWENQIQCRAASSWVAAPHVVGKRSYQGDPPTPKHTTTTHT